MIAKPSCAQALVRMLKNLGIRHVFGIPAAKIDSVFEAIVASENIQRVLCRHEQNAAFMAAAMGRMTGRVGVVLATSGPGVGNLATGLATATAEGDPVLAIGGEVPLEERVKSTHQSPDAIALLRPVTKYASEITTPTQLGELLGEAVRAAESGRPEIQRAAEILQASCQPALLLGMQASDPRTAESVSEFVASTGIPYVSTFQGPGAWVGESCGDLFAGCGGLFKNQPGDVLLAASDGVATISYEHLEYDPGIWNTGARRPIVAIDAIPARKTAIFSLPPRSSETSGPASICCARHSNPPSIPPISRLLVKPEASISPKPRRSGRLCGKALLPPFRSSFPSRWTPRKTLRSWSRSMRIF